MKIESKITPETEFSSQNYITLKQFQGGWIWVKNINDATNQILSYLEKISHDEIARIADVLNGELLSWKIFDDTQWVLRIIPIPYFVLLYVFNNDEEFGSALKLFFHKSSLRVPTEDAYVWAEYFLEFLGYFAKNGLGSTMIKQDSPDVISLTELLEAVEPTNKNKIWNDIIGQREIPLLKIDSKTAELISKQLNIQYLSGTWHENQIQWGFKFDLLKNFSIYAILLEDGTKFETFYSKNVLHFQTRRILFFTWLYCNAIIREARLILGDKLPKLSEYL